MEAVVVHSGFDGLRFTVQTDISLDFRATLADAKAKAIETNSDCVMDIGGMQLAVRRNGGSAFSSHTGEYGAEWYFLDPENRPPNNPGITVDFRAFLLATGGLRAAQEHFETCMAAFGIRYVNTQLRVSRVDFAIDILAPWFEPDREALVVPPGTRIREYTGADETETHSTGARVTGLRAGAVGNRQLVIYDKRAEIIAKGKMGWLKIWDATLAKLGKPPLDLKNRDQSQIWRFELRMGSKQLRNKWEIRDWVDLDAIIGDAFSDFCERIRYCIPTEDSNRARWSFHELWRVVVEVISKDLRELRSGVVPEEVKTANREEHQHTLDALILGLLVSRAATEGIEAENFDLFVDRHVTVLKELSHGHPTTIEDRLAKSEGKYRFR